jgi:hypothetical protein
MPAVWWNAPAMALERSVLWLSPGGRHRASGWLYNSLAHEEIKV